MSGRATGAARKRPLGAALAATVEHERERVEDRFAKAERLFGAEPPAPEAARAGAAEATAPPREKVVRDTFSFPERDHRRIAEISDAALNAAIRVNKSEIVRAGLIALQGMTAEARDELLRSVEHLKTGRPASS
ncbi:MAG: hypothetical protein R3349_00010 [Geminicoccaceae bacterium]|nr:hypothetical protein [Geminicoccaceae bacterium]